MQFSENLKILRNLIDDFGKKELMNAYNEREPTGEFPRDLVERISQIGLMGISFPEEYGGMGMDTIATSVVGERLAFYWPSLQLIWSANVSLAGFPIMTFGTEGQKSRFLPRLATGEILGCYALTEPDAGSDAANIKTVAERNVDGSWRINGTKTFITNANNASVGIVFARVRGDKDNILAGKRHAGITAFIFESKEPGLKIPGITVNNIDKWGLRCSHFCEIVMDNVSVLGYDYNVLGEIGRGFYVAMETLNNGRINIAAQSVGIARRALFEAERYGSARVAFGGPIIKKRVQARRLAGLKHKVEKAWNLTMDASLAKDSGKNYRVEAAKAKLAASEAAVQCAMFNYRIQGGFGYTTESTAISILHDALATVTYEGTSDIQRIVIAKARES